MFDIRPHQLKGFKPGIYFGQDEVLYHRDPALSRGDLVRLLVHYYDYWEQSAYNPLREVKFPTAAMKKGTKKHLYLLQPEEFKKKYRSALESYDPKKLTLPRQEYDEIIESIELLAPIYNVYFQRGYPEVSIYWQDEDTGINHRARIDYLQPYGGVDYKTVASVALNSLGWTTSDHGYDIQAMLYTQGIMAAKKLLTQGKFYVEGDVAPEWLKLFQDEPDTFFEFVFQRSQRAFVFTPIRYNAEVMKNAADAMSTGRNIFLNAMQKWGAKQAWPAGEEEVVELTPYHMPRRIFDRGLKEVV